MPDNEPMMTDEQAQALAGMANSQGTDTNGQPFTVSGILAMYAGLSASEKRLQRLIAEAAIILGS